MSVDDFAKLLLVIAVSFSLVGVSIQIMRLIGKLADSIQDLRRALQNASTVSDLALEDYTDIHKLLRGIITLITNFEESVMEPLQTVTKLAGKFFGSEKEKGEVEKKKP